MTLPRMITCGSPRGCAAALELDGSLSPFSALREARLAGWIRAWDGDQEGLSPDDWRCRDHRGELFWDDVLREPSSCEEWCPYRTRCGPCQCQVLPSVPRWQEQEWHFRLSGQHRVYLDRSVRVVRPSGPLEGAL